MVAKGFDVNNGTINHRAGLIIFCAGCLAAILSLAFSVNGLGPIDDHQFIRTIFQGKSFGAYIMPELGRFLPLTAQEYVLAAWIFEPSAYLFHVIAGLKILVCGLLLVQCLVLTKASDWAIGILWAVVIFSVGFANASFRLHVGEINALILILVYVWLTLSVQVHDWSSSKNTIVASLGVLAFTVGLLYKETMFIPALTFGIAESLRYRRQGSLIPRRILALLIMGAGYVAFYGIWRSIYSTGSYASFRSTTLLEALRFFATNDPFIILVILPLTCLRVVLCAVDARKQTVFDSLILAASAYTLGFLALGMYNTYYLLPAYGFAVCGIAGALANSSPARCIGTLLLVIIGCFGANTLPVAVSDMQTLRAIDNNHYRFVKFLSEWIWANPLPDSARRNLVLSGVTPGNGVEVLLSLRTFLVSLGLTETTFDIRASEPSDNPAITAFYRNKEKSLSVFDDAAGYTAAVGDLLIYNPINSIVRPPPTQTPSSREIYRSNSEQALPRWSGWNWVNFCMLHPQACESNISAGTRYVGYTAKLLTRLAAPVALTPLRAPSFRVGPLLLPERLRAGLTRRIEVMVENSGKEIWPGNGTLSSGIFVYFAYVWLNENGQVALEGDRSAFPEPMQPNDIARIPVLLKTPVQPGKYKLILSPVQENVRWFYANSITNSAKDIIVY